MSSIFDVEEYIASASIEGTTALIYGARKIGKTTLAVKYPNAFIMGFEIGWKGLNKVKAVPVKDWNHFKTAFVKPLIKDAKDFNSGKKPEKNFETLIMDTTDIAWEYCVSYVCAQEGVTHLDYTENKRGYKMAKVEFMEVIFSLLSAGYTMVFTSHAETKQIVGEISKEKEERTVPTMDKNAFKIIAGVVDMIVYCTNVQAKDGTMKRAAYFRDNGMFEAGSRWSEFLPTAVPLEYEAFEQAIISAVEKQAEKDGVTPSKNNKNLYKQADESIEYNYDEMMAEVRSIGKFLLSEDKIEIMNELSDEVLGVGNKISLCTKLQTEVIGNFLVRIKETMEERGLEFPKE